MAEIPKDVMERAREALEASRDEREERFRVEAIAQALMFERELCAIVAASYSNGAQELMPGVPWEMMHTQAKNVAHWTAQNIAAAIRGTADE